MALRAFLVSPGLEDALVEELGLGKEAGPRWPGVVATSRSRPAPVDPAFARQQLPDARQRRGQSVRELAEAVFADVAPACDAADRFTVHVFTPDPVAYRTVGGRAALLEEALLTLLRERRRRASRRFVPWLDGPPHGALVVQVAVVGRSSVLVSAAVPAPLPTGGFDVAPWPGGIAPVPEDRAAPSRAYRKLREGLAWLGAAPAPGESCVDLGGAPGGWAWTALARGARVTAVDRSPLSPPALGHERLTMIEGNAFAYAPRAPVDWLLCDVICEPARTLELVARWMERGWCRHVVATLKFKGRGGYGILASVRDRLAKHGWRFLRVKHLFHHHNEAAILASR